VIVDRKWCLQRRSWLFTRDDWQGWHWSNQTAADDEKTKVRISKTLQKNLQKQQQWGGSTTVKKQVSGTASSVAFTPLQVCFFWCFTKILIVQVKNNFLFCFFFLTIVFAGSWNCQSASCREKSEWGECKILFQYSWFPKSQENVNVYYK